MDKLRIHYFQHVPFEGPGTIVEWAEEHQHTLTSTKFYEDSKLPSLNDLDWLVVMGGPMSVLDEDKYPYLREEKTFIRRAIDGNKTVLGICLGSQMIAEVLGARVFKNVEKEIGWFNIDINDHARETKVFSNIESPVKVFHWHGDTFDLPEKAIPLASSEATLNQGFIYNDKVLAMQFHMETSSTSLQLMLEKCRNDLTPGNFVQTEKEILSENQLSISNRKILFTILDQLAEV